MSSESLGRRAVFRAPPWLPGRHVQTILPARWPAPVVPGRPMRRIVEVSDESAVRLELNRPGGPSRGTLLLAHGMGGSAESAYMRRTAAQALRRGWTTARMNLRNCGGTEALSRTLYNAGQSDDAARVLEALGDRDAPQPRVGVGFSLGGNLLLRYAGLAGGASRFRAVAAVNPPIDLERCARELERPANRLYQIYFVRKLRRQLERILRLREMAWAPPLPRRIRSVRQFDSLCTAPDAGFESAEAYYSAASAAPCLANLARPALILSAVNDPFVPVEIFAPHHGVEMIRFLHPEAGGHCGYWQRGTPRYWAAETILDFFDEVCG